MAVFEYPKVRVYMMANGMPSRVYIDDYEVPACRRVMLDLPARDRGAVQLEILGRIEVLYEDPPERDPAEPVLPDPGKTET